MPENDTVTTTEQVIDNDAATGTAQGQQQETATTEAKPVQETPVIEAAQGQTSKTETTAPDWKSIINTQKREDVLKEVIKDEKLQKLINLHDKGGDISEYFRAYNTDYNTIPAIDLLKQKITEENKGMEPDELNELIRYELEKKYHQSEFAEDEDKKWGAIKMKSDLKGFRDLKIEEQKNMFIDPKDPMAEVKQEKEKQEQFHQKFKATIEASPLTKKVADEKILPIKIGEGVFNMTIVDPAKALQCVTDPGSTVDFLFNEDGTPNVEEQLMLAAYLSDRKGFISRLVEHGKSLNTIDRIKNDGNIGQQVVGSSGTGGKMSIEEQIARGVAKVKQN